jgi:hypothetical protein
MNRADFETELGAQGYHEVVDRQMAANATNPEHATNSTRGFSSSKVR